jgi:hypothetical protein
MSYLGYSFRFARKSNERRRAFRRKLDADAWISMDGGFATRQCRLIDLSDSGIGIAVNPSETVPPTFTFMRSRSVASGRRVRIKWRRGGRIGALFV